MSFTQTGGPAFPCDIECSVDQADGEAEFFAWGGMTLRDHFAGLAMQSLLPDLLHDSVHHVAKVAYSMADAMLEARQK